ncbi:hypothetical protein OSB04_022274 [Centaurea solstitialis]|uniref:DUF4005 domain-containing protein n=1 Tax=Centaurea solstitialis TaxID=347529 RepID=A0AA38T732_9ASTR|nr:hypothetical protein OSB04_022274 [Centaurea solstitialis]
MGKKGSGSWLTAVKRAFRYPTKDADQDDEMRKREKRRWLFRRSSNSSVVVQHQSEVKGDDKSKTSSNDVSQQPPKQTIDHHLGATDEEKRAILMAAATIKAAEARNNRTCGCGDYPPHHQAVFHFGKECVTSIEGDRDASSGYSRPKRKEASNRNVKMHAGASSGAISATRPTIPALTRRRSKVDDVRNRKLCESKYLQDIRQRKSMSRDGSCFPDDWSDRPHTLEELDAILQTERNVKRLSPPPSPNRNPSTMDDELEESASWLDRWIEAKQWENQRTSRASFDRRDSIKTVEIDNSRPTSRSGTSIYKLPHHIPNSPSRRSSYSPSNGGQQPITPSPIKTRPLQIRSASPRANLHERKHTKPTVDPTSRGGMFRYSTCANDTAVPNYMAQPSRPRRKHGRRARQDRDPRRLKGNGGVRQETTSPQFEESELQERASWSRWYGTAVVLRGEHGGEISPCSTTDLRRWLGEY